MASAGAATRSIFSRIACTAPVISSTVSPRTLKARRKPPIWDGVASPDIMMSKASLASSRLRALPSASLAMNDLKEVMTLHPSSRLGKLEEVAENVVTVLGGDALGMKLHAMNGEPLVLQSHDCVTGLGRNLETIGQCFALDDQGVVARALEAVGHIGENAFAAMRDGRQLAMHQLLRPDDLAAECLSDGLMTEADAQNRRRLGSGPDEVEADSGFIGRAGSGRQYDRLGLRGQNLADADLVVA